MLLCIDLSAQLNGVLIEREREMRKVNAVKSEREWKIAK